MTRDDDLDRLHTAIDTLLLPRTTVEVMPGWNRHRNRTMTTHRVQHQPLLIELRLAVHHGDNRIENTGSSTVPGPRDGARLGPIYTINRIRDGALEWGHRLNTNRPKLADQLRGIAGAALSTTDDMLAWLALDAVRWVVWAEVICGWRTPPFAPWGVPCPPCGIAGGLRIHYAQQKACCLHCGADWHKRDGSIYILGEHVRGHTEGESA